MAGYECVDLERLVKNVKNVPRRPGVYSVHWFKNGRYVPINRLLGVDVKGVLYIGSTKDMRKRLRRLISVLESLYGGYYKAKRRHTFVTSLTYTYAFKRIGLSELRLCFKVFNTEDEARYNELMAILEYSRKYGEPPPFNLELGREIVDTIDTSIAGKTFIRYGLDEDLKEMLGI